MAPDESILAIPPSEDISALDNAPPEPTSFYSNAAAHVKR
jgi:hypothetical protein